MAPHEVIDLSLSTDDEQPCKAQSRSNYPEKHVEYLDSDGIFDSPMRTQQAKRRRLTPPASLIENTCGRTGNGKGNDPILSGSVDNQRNIENKESCTTKDNLGLDPIVFSSSPPLPANRSATERRDFRFGSPFSAILTDESCDNPSPEPQSATLSAATAALLAEISGNKSIMKSSRPNKRKDSRVLAEFGDLEDVERDLTSRVPKISSRQAPAGDAASKEDKIKKREMAKEERRLEREALAHRKVLERQQRAKDKQTAADLAEANKARWDKKVSTPEMIVDLPSSIDGQSVDTKVREMLKQLEVEVTTDCSLLPNVVKWRRKARAAFNEELGHWEPKPLTLLDEQHALCLISAPEFITVVAGARDGLSLDQHVSRLTNKYPSSKVIYLIEGLEAFQRKSKNQKNREYQAAVRGDAAQNVRRKGKACTGQPELDIDESIVEDALLELQMVHECLIFHTENSYESAQWIAHFTQHISTIPYRAQRSNVDASFCMEVGQVKTGDDKNDTYVKMLQQIVRVTAPIAFGIAAKYPDVLSLMDAFRRKGNLALEDLKKCTNKDGSLSDARIGPQVSRRIANVMMGEDPSSMNM